MAMDSIGLNFHSAMIWMEDTSNRTVNHNRSRVSVHKTKAWTLVQVSVELKLKGTKAAAKTRASLYGTLASSLVAQG